MTFQRTPPSGPTGAERLYLFELQRLQRMLAFTRQLAVALRQDVAGPGASPAGQALQRDLAALFTLIAQGELLVSRCATLGPTEAHRALEGYGLHRLIALARAVDGQARELRATPARLPGRGATAPLAATPQELATRRRLVPGTVIDLAAAGTARLVDRWRGDGVKLQRQIEQLARAHAMGQRVIARHAPALEILAAALEIMGPPGATMAQDVMLARFRAFVASGELAPKQQHWLPSVVPALAREPRVRQLAHVAVTHWQAARLAYGEVEVLLAAARLGEPDQAGKLLAQVDQVRMRAALTPLLHLGHTFAALPPLDRLFAPASVTDLAAEG